MSDNTKKALFFSLLAIPPSGMAGFLSFVLAQSDLPPMGLRMGVHGAIAVSVVCFAVLFVLMWITSKSDGKR